MSIAPAAGTTGSAPRAPAAGAGAAAAVPPAAPQGSTLPVPTAAPSVPGVRDRSAWQPSPIASIGRPINNPSWREVTFHSPILDRDMPYLVWLPPNYDRTTARYPTLYLLHGAGDGETAGRVEWVNIGVAQAMTDLLAKGLIQPMIIILPEGAQSYWINHANGGPRWADYVALDLVSEVDRTLRTDPHPTRRAVGGLSMGGHGAMQFALNYPQVFRIAGAHSPSIRDYEQSPSFFGDRAWFARYDPRVLARNSGAARGLTAWVDWGSRDRWRPTDEQLADALKAGGARVETHVFDGTHDDDYWRINLPQYLRFYSDAFVAASNVGGGMLTP